MRRDGGGGGERNWGGLILTIQSETAKVFSFVTSSGYVLLVTNSVQKKLRTQSWKKFSFLCLSF